MIFLIGYGTIYMTRRIRGYFATRNFPIKYREDVNGDKECAICM